MNISKTSGTKHRLAKFIKNLDVFGIPVSLTYKNEPHLKSFVGGLATMFLSQNIYYWQDNNGRSTQIKIRNRLETGKCNYGRLDIQPDTIDYLNIIKSYECPQNFNFQLQGSYSAEASRQIQVGVFPCNQTFLDIKYNKTKKCKSIEEQYRVDYFNIQEMRLDGGVQNAFIALTLQIDDTVKVINLKSLYQYQKEEKIEDNNSLGRPNSSSQRGFKKKLQDDVFYACLRRKGLLKEFGTYHQARDKLYQNGIQKISKELDIRYIVKELRNIKFVQKVLLNKYQRSMVQYFKGNLLNEAVEKKSTLSADKLLLFLRKTLLKSNQNTFDKRLLKSIELTQEENLQFQDIFKSKVNGKPQHIGSAIKDGVQEQTQVCSPLKLNERLKISPEIRLVSTLYNTIDQDQTLKQEKIDIQPNFPSTCNQKITLGEIQDNLSISEISENDLNNQNAEDTYNRYRKHDINRSIEQKETKYFNF
ncbi:UNKNOWN [Stylonychia lemnae]|uniref:Uncharacterized protein n=1 Tax=Stylonychia lemnae TaxID=5949 RepID=A0A078AA18_STYLE|nr:UNKNOWN [Stylonychia lemnae]|eukprot:CDW78736.1 UNKNOWN [Stylonychia lemnae]